MMNTNNFTKVRKRPQTWSPSSPSMITAVTAVVFLCCTTGVNAWQQVKPRMASINSRGTARQYATETELVAPKISSAFEKVTALTPRKVLVTESPHSTLKSMTRRTASSTRVTSTASVTQPKQVSASIGRATPIRRRKKTVTQIPNARRVLQPKPLKKDPSESLLTRDEEVLYAARIRALRAAIRQRDLLESPTESAWANACGITVRELRQRLAAGREAREVLVSSNVGLVTSIAKQHHSRLKHACQAGGGVGTILTLQDMVQEGNLGLLAAAERFCPERNVRFSTYAVYWIRQRIARAAQDTARVIRLPAHVHSTMSKVRSARVEFQTMQGRDPTPAELAAALDMSERKLQQLTQSSRNVISLEYPLRGNMASAHDDRRTIGESLRSDAPTPEEDALLQYLRKDVREVMQAALLESERTVLSHRFGLLDGKPLSVQETADALRWSRDKVRHTEAKALNKLRHPQRNHRLKEYVTTTASKHTIEINTDDKIQTKSRHKKKIWEESIWDAPLPKASPTERMNDLRNDATPAPAQDRLWFF